MTSSPASTVFIRNLYARMLLTRLVDERSWQLYKQGNIQSFASCRGHEAVQVGSAVCIEVGKDFTLPYYRDLGVVLTIGMTPYEVFRTYLQAQRVRQGQHSVQHWGYQKHNTVTGPGPVATQILHAAGIAFACKLRKAPVVTVAYCGDGATAEPDFAEGIRFAAQHQLPVVFICEHNCPHPSSITPSISSSLREIALPDGLLYQSIDGANILAVYTAMLRATQHAREGHGPVLLKMDVTRPFHEQLKNDPLLVCQCILQEQGAWDAEWAAQIHTRLSAEIERALLDALRENS